MEKLFSKIKRETLSAEEKAKIFYSLRDFVAKNPVQGVKSPFYEYWLIFRQRTFAVPAAFVLLLVLATGTVFAAGNALPGSTLYPVKMLRENVESMMATDTKAKAEIEASHAISRLQEIEQIVSTSGQLDKETRKKVESDFESQAKNVADNINELRNTGRSEDASKIQSDFKSMLSRQEKALDRLKSKSTRVETREGLSNFVSNIRSKMEDVSESDNLRSENRTSRDQEQNQGEVKGEETKKDNLNKNKDD